MSKYQELVGALEEAGVLQLKDEWAVEIQRLIQSHKSSAQTKTCQHEYFLGECMICGCISPTE
jgi:hypothetical protein